MSGCCLIPVARTVTVIPEAEITVLDALSGAPISGAEVRLERHQIGPPPRGVLDVENGVTTTGGIVRFFERTTKEKTYPLMMHGVSQRGWTTCVQHDEYETAVFEGRLIEAMNGHVDTPWHLTVQLNPGESTPCPEIEPSYGW